ncbi:hypothetical protein L3Y34_018358 [Caenorhabditis briggsae]|uniref:GH18 domain-containing protein n=1 Tax=Caenorhabditis briggsae TaxID=6238 RepID=A0AAE9IUN9_CAEBR|nr:hypothetical protein L3Y34_018358 [Caenorhabditis briggsae]
MSTGTSENSERLLVPVNGNHHQCPINLRDSCFFTVCSHIILCLSNRRIFHLQKRVVGYYTGWESMEINRQQLSKLTHVIFAYVEMSSNGTLKFRSKVSRRRFSDLRYKVKMNNSKTKIMFSIGGPENSNHFPEVVADSEKRKRFINSILDFLDVYRINGVDISWAWPKEEDKWNYVTFLRELRQELSTFAYILSIKVPPVNVGDWEMNYEMEEILDHVDFINAFTMDYYGAWGDEWGTPTGPSSPLYSGIGTRKTFNVNWTMKYYVCRTKRPEKFNIAIPFYGTLWRNVEDLINPDYEIWRNVELKGNKPEGRAYMSRLDMAREGWKVTPAYWDQATNSSYIWDPNKRTFLAFESDRSIEAKTNYVNEMGLGGVWIWAVDMDDERNSLLNTVTSNGLCAKESDGTIKYKC